MKTIMGIETDGTYVFYEDRYTNLWVLEINGRIYHYRNREEVIRYLSGVKYLLEMCTFYQN